MPSKKQKKKVTKKVASSAPNTNSTSYADDDDSDGIPPLETATLPNRSTRTGLSPDLESVHLSTTASLAAMTNATAEQLGKTAQDLYRGLEKDTMGMGIPEDSDYWLSLPPTIKSFVQNAYAQGVFSGTGTEPERAQQMYNVAQQMIANGHLPRVGTGKGTAPYPPGAYPAFDASVFSDPAFTQALEQLMPPNAPRFGAAGGPGTPAVSGEYIEGYFTSEDDDEVEVDVDVVNGRADTITGTHVTVSYDANGVRKMTTTNYTGTVPMPPSAMPPVDPSGKGKKKQKKKVAPVAAVPAPTTPSPPATKTAPPASIPVTPTAPTTTPMPTPAVAPLREVKQVPLQSLKPEQAPPLAPPARPAPNPAPPPPSSRAAGKQPMAYPQSAPNSTLPPRSARASGKAPATAGAHYPHHPSPPASTKAPPGKPRPPAAPATAKKAADRIWNTSSQEERERIKVFWLGLSEDERKSLVKLEKDAVLKKMKEQQRHSCSCAVCGRKRTAIEAELEVLYGAYYDELRTYASHQQQHATSGGKVPAPPGPGPFPGSVEIDNRGEVVPNALTKHPAPPVPPDDYEDDEDEEEDYDDEGSEDGSEEEDDDDETEPPPPAGYKGARRSAPPPNAKAPPGKGVNGTPPKRAAAGAASNQDFFTFGPGLTVAGPGNILTVADDLLKNDGQKFLEMMEQLAERRMLREEAAAEAIMSEEDSDDEDDSEDDSGSEDDEDEDDDDDELMTEEQKMEEGRRMFSIFAARMFEQRVLHAYRERVAQDRQNQLLRELEEEDKAAADREAKRQKENQKKKDKKRAQKEAKEEQAARRAAEKAAEETAAKEKKRAEEDEARKIRDEERLKKEAEKKAKEEERMMKEMERRKRLAEEKEKEKEREVERKKKEKEERDRQREEKERLKKEREDKERLEKERQKKVDEEKAAAEAVRLKDEASKRAKEEKERLEREAREASAKKAAEEKAVADKAAAASAAAAAAAATASRNAARTNGQTQGKKSVTKQSAAAGPSNSAGPSMTPGLIRPGPPLSIPPPHPPRPIQPQGPPIGPPSRRPTGAIAPPQSLPSGLQPAMGSSSHAPFPQGPPGMAYGPPSPIAPMNFGAGPSQYGMQGPLLPQQVPVLQPSPLPRGYGQNVMGGSSLGQGDYHAPIQPQQSSYQPVPPPIGPPSSRGIPSPAPIQLMSPGGMPQTNGSQNFSPGPPVVNRTAHSRRSSLDPGPIGGRAGPPPQFGAITRPIAPIGTRPSNNSMAGPSSSSSSMAPGGPVSGGASGSSSKIVDGEDGMLKGSGDLTGSPERLGSSALADPEDEALPSAGGRRVGVMGSVWGPPGSDMGKSSADSRGFGSGAWSAFNSPAQQTHQQLSSPLSATPWNSSAAPGGNWPNSGGPSHRGTVGFGGLPPPNIGGGMGSGLGAGGAGSIGTPFLQGNFGFPPGAFGAPGNSPGGTANTQSSQ